MYNSINIVMIKYKLRINIIINAYFRMWELFEGI